MNNVHPWESARSHFDTDVLPVLQRAGKRIGDDASAGCGLAKQVIAHYTLLHRSFDPLTLLLLEKALTAWLDKPLSSAPSQAAGGPQ